ncbi:hypothetical protein E2C01_020133 [Portunus trituberculatus]|uniref:Uncharacterized protein n=1 Tax=Portunus trituberculatus TaxID=210409 RepID=A0A5B7DZ60_PORTR|nr:hypothetical protein [Portunus trituberculatus]
MEQQRHCNVRGGTQTPTTTTTTTSTTWQLALDPLLALWLVWHPHHLACLSPLATHHQTSVW